LIRTEVNTALDFESLYLALRQKENRLYTDAELILLPEIHITHPYLDEWEIRKRSMKRLREWLSDKNRPLKILEAGCGNGWLSAQLSLIPGADVTGIDINKAEIMQAKRVFDNRANLRFFRGSIADIMHRKFDVVLFAASIQYFPSLENTIRDILPVLENKGEIHIIDSPLYKRRETTEASIRSRIYYQCMGMNDMHQFYFHHSKESLKNFHHTYLFDPSTLKNKIVNKHDPFPWVCITAS
jgi:SAM-dependent methyltransferase